MKNFGFIPKIDQRGKTPEKRIYIDYWVGNKRNKVYTPHSTSLGYIPKPVLDRLNQIKEDILNTTDFNTLDNDRISKLIKEVIGGVKRKKTKKEKKRKVEEGVKLI
ncbi:MAG TPA: hypothetical protein PK825_07400 [Bacteroidales bacterium]|nr:hypothetical protein [Bacteroidales bacterium]